MAGFNVSIAAFRHYLVLEEYGGRCWYNGCGQEGWKLSCVADRRYPVAI